MHAAQLIDPSNNISLRNSIYEALKRLRNENPSHVNFSFLNLNSVRYEFEDLKFFCINKVDILLLGFISRCTAFIEGYNKYFS